MNPVPHAIQAAPGGPSPGAAAVDVRDVLIGIWRRRWYILLASVVAGLLGIAFVVTADPSYEAQSRVLVDNLETTFSRTQVNDRGEGVIQPIDVTSQVELVKSRDLAKRVIDRLDLTSRGEFDPLKKPLGVVKRLKIRLGFAPDPRKQTPQQRALGAYFAKLNAYSIPDSKVIVIEFKAGNPGTAAELANTLAEIYITATREAQSETTNRARDWLGRQIEDLRREVVRSDAAVERYRAEAGLVRGNQQSPLSTQELSELNSQIILAEAARSEAEARARAIRDQLARTGTVDTSVDVLNSSLIQRLREQQIALRRTLAELSATYLPNHPRIKSTQQEMSDLNNQIRNEALKIVESLTQQAGIAAAREKSLRDSLARVKTKVSQDSLDEVELRSLERESKANRDLLEIFLGKYSDASARDALVAQPGLARIISRADVPSEPAFPKPGPIVLLASLAGLGLAIGLAFMAEVMRAAGQAYGPPVHPVMPAPAPVVPQPAPPAVAASPAHPPGGEPAVFDRRSPPPAPNAPVAPQPVAPQPAAPQPAAPQPAVAAAAAPVAAPAPAAAAAPPQASLCSIPKINDPLAGQALALQARSGEGDCGPAARTLASWAQTMRQTLGIRRIAISGVGVSSLQTGVVAAALVRQLDAQGIKAIVVDADLDGEGLRGLMCASRGTGLAELLGETASFTDVVIKDEASNAHLIRAGADRELAASMAGSKRFATVLEALDHVYDVVVLHIGGGKATEHGMLTMVSHAEGALVVAAASQQQIAAQVIAVLTSSPLRAVETVLVKDTPNAEGDRRFRNAA